MILGMRFPITISTEDWSPCGNSSESNTSDKSNAHLPQG